MDVGAFSPEELDTLIEDAFVVRDRASVVALFEADAMVAAGGSVIARGAGIAPFVAGLWARDVTYLAGLRRVLQAKDIALIVAERDQCRSPCRRHALALRNRPARHRPTGDTQGALHD